MFSLLPSLPPSLPPSLLQVAHDTGVRQFREPGLGYIQDSLALLPDDVEWILSSGVNVSLSPSLPPSLPPSFPPQKVAYDTGVRQFCVPGLGHMKDSSALLPDDVEWILSSGVNEKSVRRLPAIEGVRAVYISNLETALLLEEALRKVRLSPSFLPSLPPSLPPFPQEEHRLATRPSHNKVSRSRDKVLVAQKKNLQETNLTRTLLPPSLPPSPQEEHRLATRPSHNKVSRSRAKFLVAQQKKKTQEKKAKRKKEAEGEGEDEGGREGGMEEGAEEELGFQLLKAVVLAPTNEEEDVMLLANSIR